jgi:hypothetical protein
MTLEDVVRELVQCLGSDGDTTLTWEQVRAWPKGAVDVVQEAGWIKPTCLGEMVECPGCEENCFMPVHVFPAQNGQPMRAFVACDKRNDIGKVKIPLARLQQWRLTQGHLVQWIANVLSLRFSGKRLDGGNLLELGMVAGNKRTQMLCLRPDADLALVAGSSSIPLAEAIRFSDGRYTLDADMIRHLVDASTTRDARYSPSTARREVRKQETEAMHEGWRKAYRDLKKKRPNMSGVWYSQQIAKMDIAHGRDSETIRKEMKK